MKLRSVSTARGLLNWGKSRPTCRIMNPNSWSACAQKSRTDYAKSSVITAKIRKSLQSSYGVVELGEEQAHVPDHKPEQLECLRTDKQRLRRNRRVITGTTNEIT
jgi:hypothetical protein